MTFAEQKQMLLDKANYLLKFVTQKEMFGGTHDVMNDEHIKVLEIWRNEAEDFVERFGLATQKERFGLSLNIIDYNHNRVDVSRIKSLLSEIERVCVDE